VPFTHNSIRETSFVFFHNQEIYGIGLIRHRVTGGYSHVGVRVYGVVVYAG